MSKELTSYKSQSRNLDSPTAVHDSVLGEFPVAIVGWRKFHDYEYLCEKVLEWEKKQNKPISCVVSGGAEGTDSMARRFAKEFDKPMIELKPEWEKYRPPPGSTKKNPAALIRNGEIVKLAKHVLAFVNPEARGTQDAIRKASNLGKPITTFDI